MVKIGLGRRKKKTTEEGVKHNCPRESLQKAITRKFENGRQEGGGNKKRRGFQKGCMGRITQVRLHWILKELTFAASVKGTPNGGGGTEKGRGGVLKLAPGCCLQTVCKGGDVPKP